MDYNWSDHQYNELSNFVYDHLIIEFSIDVKYKYFTITSSLFPRKFERIHLNVYSKFGKMPEMHF